MWFQTLFPPVGHRSLGRDGVGLQEALPIVSGKQGKRGRTGKEGCPLLSLALGSLLFHLVPHSGKSELPGQEMAPLLPEM